MKNLSKAFLRALFILFLGIIFSSTIIARDLKSEFAQKNFQQYQITASDYCAFLNAMAPSDPYHLYGEQMAKNSLSASIVRLGYPGTYCYEVMAGCEDQPMSLIANMAGMRYCNWLEQGKPNYNQNPSATEEGAYKIDGDTISSEPNPGALFLIMNDQGENLSLASANKTLLIKEVFPWQLALSNSHSIADHWTEGDRYFLGGIFLIYMIFKGKAYISHCCAQPSEPDAIGEEPVILDHQTVKKHDSSLLGNYRNFADQVDTQRTVYIHAKNDYEKAQQADGKTIKKIQQSAVTYSIAYLGMHALKFGVATAFPQTTVVLYGSDAITCLFPEAASNAMRIVLGEAYNSIVAVPIRSAFNGVTEPVFIEDDHPLEAEYHVEYLCPKVVRFSLKWLRDRNGANQVVNNLKKAQQNYNDAISRADEAYALAIQEQKERWISNMISRWSPFSTKSIEVSDNFMTLPEDRDFYRIYTDQQIGAHVTDEIPRALVFPEKNDDENGKVFFQTVKVPQGTQLKKLLKADDLTNSHHEYQLWDLIPEESFTKGVPLNNTEDLQRIIQEQENGDWILIDNNGQESPVAKKDGG